MLLRGHVGLDEVHHRLENAGYGWLRLHDNGILRRRSPGLEVGEVHVYNLLPRGVSKATAVAADLVDRGIDADEAVAIGDSASDLALAPHVATLFLVAGSELSAELPNNVGVTEAGHGEGFAEAVLALLA